MVTTYSMQDPCFTFLVGVVSLNKSSKYDNTNCSSYKSVAIVATLCVQLPRIVSTTAFVDALKIEFERKRTQTLNSKLTLAPVSICLRWVPQFSLRRHHCSSQITKSSLDTVWCHWFHNRGNISCYAAHIQNINNIIMSKKKQ